MELTTVYKTACGPDASVLRLGQLWKLAAKSAWLTESFGLCELDELVHFHSLHEPNHPLSLLMQKLVQSMHDPETPIFEWHFIEILARVALAKHQLQSEVSSVRLASLFKALVENLISSATAKINSPLADALSAQPSDKFQLALFHKGCSRRDSALKDETNSLRNLILLTKV